MEALACYCLFHLIFEGYCRCFVEFSSLTEVKSHHLNLRYRSQACLIKLLVVKRCLTNYLRPLSFTISSFLLLGEDYQYSNQQEDYLEVPFILNQVFCQVASFQVVDSLNRIQQVSLLPFPMQGSFLVTYLELEEDPFRSSYLSSKLTSQTYQAFDQLDLAKMELMWITHYQDWPKMASLNEPMHVAAFITLVITL